MLHEKILKLKQNINSVGVNWPLTYVKTDFLEKIELELHQDRFFKSIVKKMDVLADNCDRCIEDYESINELKNLYSEAYIYSKLRSLLFIEKVTEASNGTPDFKVMFRSSPIYIEMKALNMVDGSLKNKTIMNEALDSKIDLEDQKKRGCSIAVSEQVIQPYYASGKPYDSSTPKTIIQTLIDKISQNLKSDQFKQGNTVLLVDLDNQLPVPFPERAIHEYYEEDGYKVSGALWHTAFRSINSKIHRVPEFEGKPVYEELDREGILNSSRFVKGLIFHIDEKFYALAKSADENINVINMMEYLCSNTTVYQE